MCRLHLDAPAPYASSCLLHAYTRAKGTTLESGSGGLPPPMLTATPSSISLVKFPPFTPASVGPDTSYDDESRSTAFFPRQPSNLVPPVLEVLHPGVLRDNSTHGDVSPLVGLQPLLLLCRRVLLGNDAGKFGDGDPHHVPRCGVWRMEEEGME